MKKVFILFCLPLFASCKLNVVQLPCIYGEWEILQLQTSEGQSVDSIYVEGKLSLRPRTMLNFQKNDEAIFSLSDSVIQTLKFGFNIEGIRFLTAPEDIWAKDIKVEKDTMTLQLDSILVILARPKID